MLSALRPSTSTALLFVLVFVASGGCAADASYSAGDEERSGSQAVAVVIDDFTVGKWSLRVNRTWNRTSPVTLPSAMLSESDYTPVSEPTVHAVVVSSGGSAVVVDSMAGSLTLAQAGTDLAFELTEGTFAGGRFLVWQGPNSLEGELTLYGSGLPILQSHRGELVRDP